MCSVLLLCITQLFAQKRTYTTVKISETPPKIDGILDENVWNKVEWTGDFVQFEPFSGQPATQKTEFKIIYDDNNLYFAVRCYDSSPDSIVKRMSRRDGDIGDWVKIVIDSYHDFKTAFSFGVSAAGVKIDEIITDDSNWDASWDPIWYVKTSADEKGWTVEASIPFSQLRFGKQDEYVWGLEVGRRLYRKEEYSIWQFVSPTAAGFLIRVGELYGIRDIQPKKQRELVPYIALGRETYQRDPDNPFANGKAYLKNAGIDGKFGITNNLTLDFTINPDFGQIEADPSEVNLTTFETKFSEKRPFFIEGKNILSLNLLNGGGPLSTDNLFYSRRIGKSPSYSPDLEDGEYIDSPEKTSILGALKVTGRTQNGWSIGILESITQKETAEIYSDGKTHDIIVEPFSNYFISRVKKDMNQSNTVLGAMFTATNRNITEDYLDEFMHRQAYSAGIDFFHQWKEKTYYVSLTSAISRVMGSHEAILNTQTSAPHYFQRPFANHLSIDSTRRYLDGWGGTIQAGKAGNGKWMYTCWITFRSPGLNLNDVGYINRTDEIQEVAWLGFRQREPFSIFRNFNLNFNQWYGLSFGLERRYFGGNINGNWMFKNYWSMGFGVDRDQKNISTETLRGGPALLYDGSFNFYPYVQTDERKKIQFGYFSYYHWRDHETAQVQNHEFSIRLQLSDACNMSLSPGYNKRYDKIEYVSTLDDLEEVRYIRGTIHQTTAYMTIRFDYNITPDFTVQFYGMPFISAGKYSELKYINDADADNFTDRFIPYTEDQLHYNSVDEVYEVDENNNGVTDYTFDRPDFNVFDFNSNLVIRWEYRPGSILYLVWSQKRNEYLSTGRFDMWDDTKTLFKETYPHDILLIKLSYRFGL
jgi:hypothetical protein